MPPPNGSILHYLQIALAAQRGGSLSDAELLDRFAQGEEQAFAILVARYGPLVWRTCSRLLGDTPDAEDTFQATFLILARRSRTLGRGPLSSWLYETARRASLKARTLAVQRRQREQPFPHDGVPVPAPMPEQTDLRTVLEEELAALPEKLRVVVVLVHIEGRTKTEVAQLLRLSFRAVDKRLDRAEQLLQGRLGRRGLAIASSTLAAILSVQSASNAMPPALIPATTHAAFAFAQTGDVIKSGATELAAKLLSQRPPVALVAFAVTIVAVATIAVAAALPGSPSVENQPRTLHPQVSNWREGEPMKFGSGKQVVSPKPGLVISEIFTNPSKVDSPFEYAELLATRDIEFSQAPHSVVFTDTTGSPGNHGWVNGGTHSYGFNITSGRVSRGQVVYVGGALMVPTGTQLRVINTATTEGDRFGRGRKAGVLGNGGRHADGVAVFDIDINSITASTAPVDAVLFGSEVGDAANANYVLPVSDCYAGGIADGTSFLAPDPNTNEILRASGTFDPALGAWTEKRSWTLVKTHTSGTTLIRSAP